MGAGVWEVVVALAAIAGAVWVWDKLTEGTRKAREAVDKAIDSMRELTKLKGPELMMDNIYKGHDADSGAVGEAECAIRRHCGVDSGRGDSRRQPGAAIPPGNQGAHGGLDRERTGRGYEGDDGPVGATDSDGPGRWHLSRSVRIGSTIRGSLEIQQGRPRSPVSTSSRSGS